MRANGSVWTAKTEELFLNLLSVMATNLGFSFDLVQLKRGAYFPKGHGDFETDNLLTRKGVLDLLESKRPLKMEIRNIPSPQPTPPPAIVEAKSPNTGK